MISISDSIGFSKSDRKLMPILRDLIEANIKRKRQLLLTWRNLLFPARRIYGLGPTYIAAAWPAAPLRRGPAH
ncbi:Hypothetical protein PMT_2497 [Prochlorococcus marinus str. MIT 9313]|uniref:Uncharacterized protein n=1 Tax=Prochlorococcus marinus (strain MIT 9313) TaxID=74547 RepID=B9ERY7_PROMM|nr:Hypothetical protein PMT_2497 [Prochlorococcus marinus str. MIT 9313]